MACSSSNFTLNLVITTSSTNSLRQFSVLVVTTSGQFSCKLEKFYEEPLKWFSLKKIRHLLRIFYPIKSSGLKILVRGLTR